MIIYKAIRRTGTTTAKLGVELSLRNASEEDARKFVEEAIRYYAHAVIWRIGKQGKYDGHVVKVRE